MKTKTSGLHHCQFQILVAAAIFVNAGLLGNAAAGDVTVAWTNNMLTVNSLKIPGERVETLYLEAFCKKGSTNRTWDKTTIPHSTKLLRAAEDGSVLELESDISGLARVHHVIRAVADGAEFRLTVTNLTNEAQDIDWAQPCMRVNRFTGLKQEDYWKKCFIFTERGLTMLDQLPRNEEAIYKGGQVYVPPGVNREDVNPRPLSSVVPVNGLTGAVSADGKMLLAVAWDHTQELFQGVIVCMHSDFRIGGLRPGETKKIFGKFYVMENDPAKLLRIYHKDFPHWREDMLDLRGPREPVLRRGRGSRF